MTPAYGREAFHALAAGGLRKAYRDLLDRPAAPTGDEELDWLMNELAVRELLAAYCFARDSKDADWTLSLFADDATVDGESGHTALARRHAADDGAVLVTWRRYANPVVRFDASGDEGWVAAYAHSTDLTKDNSGRSRFGCYFGRIRRVGGAWRIADWRAETETTLEFANDRIQPLWGGALVQPPGLHRDIAMNEGRRRFYEIAEEPWGGARALLNRPVKASTPAQKIAVVVENIRLRDFFTRYVESYDSNNVARVMDRVLAGDTVHQHRADKLSYLIGRDEVRKQYQIWNASRRLSFHRVSNIVARVSDGGDEALACAYFNAPVVGHTTEPQAQFGGYFFRLLKEEGEWRLADRRQIGSAGRVVVFPYRQAARA